MENTAQELRLRPLSPLVQAATLLDKTRLIIVAAFLGILATRSLADPDYFWHLKTGEFIVSNWSLPDGDIFSHVRFGQEWVLHEWLFEVILYCVYSVGGGFMVTLMTTVLGMLPVLIVARSALRITGDRTATFIAVAAGFAAFAGSITPRPQLISFCLLAYYLSSLIDFKYGKKNLSLLWIPAAMVVWVNAHGGFLVGVAFLFAFTGCEWLRAWFSDAYSAVADRTRLVRLTWVSALALLATLANPDFIWHWEYPIMVLDMQANAMILEWQSPNFHADGPERAYLLAVALFVVTHVYADRKRDITEIAIPGLFILNGFISLRHIPLASLVAIPFFALALHDNVHVRVSRWLRARAVARVLDRIPGARRELGPHEFILNWIVLCVVIIGFVALRPVIDEKQRLLLERTYPVKAVDFVIANGMTGVMYNEYNHGGYLIYRLAPQIKVMIDGRADMYGDDWIMDYGDISAGRQGWKEKLDTLNIDFAITGVNSPIRQLMLHVAGFREVYADQQFSVLIRRHAVVAASKN